MHSWCQAPEEQTNKDEEKQHHQTHYSVDDVGQIKLENSCGDKNEHKDYSDNGEYQKRVHPCF